jgi:hypothetical protein
LYCGGSGGIEIHRIRTMNPMTPTAPGEVQRRRRQFRIRSMMLAVALVAVWIWVLLDPFLGRLVLAILLWIGGTLAVVAAAMGLGLLGFGLCTAGERAIGWLRRAASWPEE